MKKNAKHYVWTPEGMVEVRAPEVIVEVAAHLGARGEIHGEVGRYLFGPGPAERAMLEGRPELSMTRREAEREYAGEPLPARGPHDRRAAG